MKITRPRLIDFFVLATGFFSFPASSRVSLAGASPDTPSTPPQARSASAPHLLKYTGGMLLYARMGLDAFIVANGGLRRQQRTCIARLKVRSTRNAFDRIS